MRAARDSSYTRRMRMLKIEDSSNVAEIGYDGNSVLRVRFVNGGLYEYDDVSPQLFSSIVCAMSVGKTLSERIKAKPDVYRCRKIEAPARLQKGALVNVRTRAVRVLEVSDAHGLFYLVEFVEEKASGWNRAVWLSATEFEVA